MGCSFPPPLTDDQITDALDGAADQEVQDHLAVCAHCSARLVQARRAERVLHTNLRRLDCPTPRQLGDYELKLVSKTDERAIARHLRTCVRCTDELEELRAYLVVDQAPREPARSSPTLGALGKLFGQIMPRSSASALRGAGPEPIIAEADGTTIILNVQPAPNGRVTIQGQVIADDLAPWTSSLVELRQIGALQATSTVNGLGGFSLEPLPAAVSELRLTPQRGRIVVLPDIQLIT